MIPNKLSIYKWKLSKLEKCQLIWKPILHLYYAQYYEVYGIMLLDSKKFVISKLIKLSKTLI